MLLRLIMKFWLLYHAACKGVKKLVAGTPLRSKQNVEVLFQRRFSRGGDHFIAFDRRAAAAIAPD